MKIVKVQHTFSGGEVSPVIHQARTDLEIYRKCLVKCSNYIPLLQGSLIRRPPMVDLGVKFSDTPRKALKYRDEKTNNEFLIIPQNKKSIVFDTSSETKVTEINTPWKLEDVDHLDYVQIKKYLLVVHQDYLPVLLYPEQDDESSWVSERYTPPTGPYLTANSGSNILSSLSTLTISKDEADVKDNKVLHKNDFFSLPGWSYFAMPYMNPVGATELYIYNENTIESSEPIFSTSDAGRHITFESEISLWEQHQIYREGAKVISSKNDMIYELVEELNDSPQPSISIPSGSGFYFEDGRHIWKKLYPSTEDNIYFQYHGVIKEYVSDKKVKALIFSRPNSFYGKATTDKWALGAWCKLEGYPSLVTLYDGRLVFSGYKKRPSHIDFSEVITSSNFRDIGFKQTDGEGKVQKNSALSLSMDFGARKEEKIQWMEGFNHRFLVGTDSNEWELGPVRNTDGFSPLNFGFNCISSYGSEKIPPVRIGRSLIFIQRAGRIIRELKAIKNNVYKAIDITMYANHLTDGFGREIKQLVYQKNPHSILWAVTHDGRLLGCTVDLDNSVYAWHSHEIEDDQGDIFNMIVDYADQSGEEGIILGSKASLQLMKIRSFHDKSTFHNDFYGSPNESSYISRAEFPRIDDVVEPAYVGGKRRLISAKIRTSNVESLLCGTINSRLVKAKIDPSDGLGLVEVILDAKYGRDEGLCIVQDEGSPGVILQVMTISELQNVR
ncbi:MAG: hypothetical protein C4617_04440 [Candidatus Liberibacter europaeus]|uniref:Uncharacterized protein n=1 Tax=Candidatus Liberibacter europaeus TaxID=744859 RepID=A0A2T4VWX3_9HYPH|nr:hypothetical protein [Candidatus Liberibacter europaeus]PTL86260.1 MAG: hypothetical protein C4617_04440 [Candidatus Liberibacter europaeus]